MKLSELNKRLADARLVYLLVAASLVIGISSFVRGLNPKPQLMFVQAAEDIRADETAHSLRLVNASHQTLYFSDRPVRIAGHIKMEDTLFIDWVAARPGVGAGGVGRPGVGVGGPRGVGW